MKKLLLLLLIIGSFFFSNPTPAHACSCIPPAPPQESLEKSSAVFVGKVTDIEIQNGILYDTSDPVQVTFDVSKIWKGPEKKILVVTTARDSASCEFNFTENEEYLVYAIESENTLRTGICSRTALLTNAQEDIEKLGEAKEPSNQVPTETPPFYNPILILVAGSVLVIILVLLLIRKRKK